MRQLGLLLQMSNSMIRHDSLAGDGAASIATVRAGIVPARDRLSSRLRETPMVLSAEMSEALGLHCWFKMEQLQNTGSFKIRGALNCILQHEDRARDCGVIAASSGNHGIAVAHACKELGIAAEIHVSAHANLAKLDQLRSAGVTLVEYPGTDTADAELGAREKAERQGAVLISPYNDIDVVTGQATLGDEVIRQLPDVAAVFVSVGGGGLVCGVASAVKAVNPEVEIVGVWAENSAALYYALQAGAVVDYPELPTLSDGTAGGMDADSITLAMANCLIDRCVLIPERAISSAGQRLVESNGWLVEPSAALALAGLVQVAGDFRDRPVCVVLCGQNSSWDPAKETQRLSE